MSRFSFHCLSRSIPSLSPCCCVCELFYIRASTTTTGTSTKACVSTHVGVCLFPCASRCYFAWALSSLQRLSTCWRVGGPALWSGGGASGWSPIMLGRSQTQPRHWPPGGPSHRRRCYAPPTTSLASTRLSKSLSLLLWSASSEERARAQEQEFSCVRGGSWRVRIKTTQQQLKYLVE